MKLYEIDSSIEASEQGTNWTSNDHEIVFNAIKNTDMSFSEMGEFAKELKEKHNMKRTPFAIKLGLVRMSVAVKGKAPSDVTDSSMMAWINNMRPSVQFAKGKGFDNSDEIEIIKDNVTKRVTQKKNKMTPVKARQIVLKYFNDHQHELVSKVKSQRDKLEKEIMNGKSPEEAFKPYRKVK